MQSANRLDVEITQRVKREAANQFMEMMLEGAMLQDALERIFILMKSATEREYEGRWHHP